GVSREIALCDTDARAVRPLNSRPTLVSDRIGVALLTASMATTCDGLSGSSVNLVTSRTRLPLNRTLPPTCRPDTVLSKMTRQATACFLPADACSQNTKQTPHAT